MKEDGGIGVPLRGCYVHNAHILRKLSETEFVCPIRNAHFGCLAKCFTTMCPNEHDPDEPLEAILMERHLCSLPRSLMSVFSPPLSNECVLSLSL